MNENDRQARISQLQNHRHALLRRREERDAAVASIDMELNVVRSELQALYEAGRVLQQTPMPRVGANRARIA
ncbi:hypothetical protein [Acidithiobacillus sp.]|uniref:hypothetical protein n=1 Tax=Acidithiobacillus sp. TaxID=1872118 RepID=UPI0025C0D9E8|nr:hypothetical protein [Acidithiobacillus sp.]